MEIIIKNKIIPPVHKNEYKFDVLFMSGDADAFETKTVFVGENHADLKRFIEFTYRCKNFYVGRGGGGSDEYYEVEDFGYFADESTVEDIYLEWPYDPMGDCQQTLYNITITFFDNKGDEFNVEIKQ